MKKHHPDNERIKHKYFGFLKQAKQLDEASVDAAAKAISRFEQYTKYKDFKAFHFNQAVAFKRHLADQRNPKINKPLSKATMHSTMRALKAFFQWLAMQGGYKSRIDYSEIEYFNLSEKDVRTATAKRDRPVPSLDQINRVLSNMPNENAIEKRNRALIAFTILTGARDGALTSFKIKHVDMAQEKVSQDARDVKTKGSKTFISYFFPVGELAPQIVNDWVQFVTEELGYGSEDPLFPKTEIKRGQNKVFEAVGLKPEHWSNADPVRKIFKQAFEQSGLQYFNPHSFRKTLAQLGERKCKTPEEFKAWSQNLGHEEVLTTFSSYGEVQPNRQGEILQNFRNPVQSLESDVEPERALEILKAHMLALKR